MLRGKRKNFGYFNVDLNPILILIQITFSTWESNPSPYPSTFKNIQGMYEDELLKDFELRCSDRKNLKCHKTILATQSPVFYAMLTNDLQEAREGFAEVPDFDSVLMTQVLRFIYCLPVENLDTIAEELIFASEFYDLDDLKKECIESIAGNLTSDNVIETLLISDKISGSQKLFQECITVVAG